MGRKGCARVYQDIRSFYSDTRFQSVAAFNWGHCEVQPFCFDRLIPYCICKDAWCRWSCDNQICTIDGRSSCTDVYFVSKLSTSRAMCRRFYEHSVVANISSTTRIPRVACTCCCWGEEARRLARSDRSHRSSVGQGATSAHCKRNVVAGLSFT